MDSGETRVTGVEETTAVDRISQLPDCLLLHILSFMPTAGTVFTSTLSKRWRYLWNSLDTFSFCTFDYDQGYVSYVDFVLGHSVSSKIKNFQLDSYEPEAYKSGIDRWLSFAVERKVKNLKLRSHSDDDVYALLECLYICSSLITLVLEFWEFDANVVIASKSLKSIKLKCVMLSNDQIVNLLSGCPELETMELSGFKGFSRLEIRSSKLTRLDLIEYNDDDLIHHSLEIISPYLQHLEISGNLRALKCRIVDVSSLVNAKLTFSITCIKDIRYFLHDQVLFTWKTIVRTIIKVLCMLQNNEVPIPELKCRYLTLELHMKQFSVYGAAGLLRASPHVETLNIDISAFYAILVIIHGPFWCHNDR